MINVILPLVMMFVITSTSTPIEIEPSIKSIRGSYEVRDGSNYPFIYEKNGEYYTANSPEEYELYHNPVIADLKYLYIPIDVSEDYTYYEAESLGSFGPRDFDFNLDEYFAFEKKYQDATNDEARIRLLATIEIYPRTVLVPDYLIPNVSSLKYGYQRYYYSYGRLNPAWEEYYNDPTTDGLHEESDYIIGIVSVVDKNKLEDGITAELLKIRLDKLEEIKDFFGRTFNYQGHELNLEEQHLISQFESDLETYNADGLPITIYDINANNFNLIHSLKRNQRIQQVGDEFYNNTGYDYTNDIIGEVTREQVREMLLRR